MIIALCVCASSRLERSCPLVATIESTLWRYVSENSFLKVNGTGIIPFNTLRGQL